MQIAAIFFIFPPPAIHLITDFDFAARAAADLALRRSSGIGTHFVSLQARTLVIAASFARTSWALKAGIKAPTGRMGRAGESMLPTWLTGISPETGKPG